MRAACDSLLRAGPTCVVADASVVINLSASLGFETVLRRLPYRFLVSARVRQELETGRKKGHTAAADLESQVAADRAEIVTPGELARGTYQRLAQKRSGRLNAGEAETIACALELNAVALIDENRARRTCEAEFPWLSVASTVDVFAHPRITGLGQPALASLVRNAVRHGRMHVVRCEEWVEELVGIDIRTAGTGER